MRPATDEMHEQLLPFKQAVMSAAAWEEALSEQLSQPCEVVYGRSRSTPVQVLRHDGRATRIRLHHFFKTAPQAVVESLGRWIQVGRRARRASRLLDDWIATQLSELPAPGPGRLKSQGQVYDLGALLADVAREHVPELVGQAPGVTWGPRRRSRSRRSLHLGSFDPQTRVIRIHPVLDHPSVPEFFVRFVLFHELLHAAIPTKAQPGSRHHPPAFRRRERAHPDYKSAVKLEASELDSWIRRARRGYTTDPRV